MNDKLVSKVQEYESSGNMRPQMEPMWAWAIGNSGIGKWKQKWSNLQYRCILQGKPLHSDHAHLNDHFIIRPPLYKDHIIIMSQRC